MTDEKDVKSSFCYSQCIKNSIFLLLSKECTLLIMLLCLHILQLNISASMATNVTSREIFLVYIIIVILYVIQLLCDVLLYWRRCMLLKAVATEFCGYFCGLCSCRSQFSSRSSKLGLVYLRTLFPRITSRSSQTQIPLLKSTQKMRSQIHRTDARILCPKNPQCSHTRQTNLFSVQSIKKI